MTSLPGGQITAKYYCRPVLLVPVGRAFFDEGAHAFLCVVAGTDSDVEIECCGEVVGNWALVELVEKVFCGFDGLGGAFEEFVAVGFDGIVEEVGGYGTVDESCGFGAFGVDDFSCEEEFAGEAFGNLAAEEGHDESGDEAAVDSS